jgi:hypothetical protein
MKEKITTEASGIESPGAVRLEGIFTWEPKTNYGFIVPAGTGGKGYFLSAHTLREARKGYLKNIEIRTLNARRLAFYLRPSSKPEHHGKLEAYQVELLSENYAL